MVGVDPELGSSALRVWLAAGSAMLLFAAGVVLLAQRQMVTLNAVVSTGVVIFGAMFAAWLWWISFGRPPTYDQDADRRALELRAAELSGVALAAGSPLACLDAMAGDTVLALCEKALFASPATVAADLSYVAARLTLLSDMVAYTERGGTGIDDALQPLRRALEADRYGFLAHVLAVRDHCTMQNCKALALLDDSSQVRANLSGEKLDHYLDQYQTVWAQPQVPVAEAAPAEPTTTAELVPPAQRKVLVNIDFPSAASIPPISIMNPEPTGRVPLGAPIAGGNANATTVGGGSPRRARKDAAAAGNQVQSAAQSVSPDATQAQADSVWQPTSPVPMSVSAPQPAAAPAAPAAAASLTVGAGAPVQLNPYASPQ
jgi:hypothetical protein